MTRAQKVTGEIVEYLINSDYTVLAGLSVKLIAARYKLCPRYLSRIFKDRYGISLLRYLKRIKLVKSALLLLDSTINLKIWQIAQCFGFDRPDSFIKDFKEFFLVTPGKFRDIYNMEVK